MSEARPADLVVRGRIVTMDGTDRIIRDGAVIVAGARIVEVGERAELLRRYTAPRSVGDETAIVIPGLIDGHTHCTQSLVRSLTAGELPMIHRLYIPAQRALPEEDVRTSVQLIAAQLLRSGVTTLAEGTLNLAHEEPVAETMQAIGMRCCMSRAVGDQDHHHAALYSQSLDQRSWVRPRPGEAERDLARTEAFLRRYPPSGDGLLVGSVCASGLTGYSAEYFRGASALARAHDTALQVHIARDREEVEFSLDVFGCRPIERLAELGVVDRHLLAVHAVLATEPELNLLASGGASVLHSPIECVSNLNAVPNIAGARARGITVALGCDNQTNDMLEVMRACWLIHHGLWGMPVYDPEPVTAAEILAMATRAAARALHLDRSIGSLEAGKAADLVVLDGRAPHLMAEQDLVTELVRYAARSEVEHVIVGGRFLIEHGRHTTIDIEALHARARAGAARVRTAIEKRRYRPLRGA